VDGLGRAVQPGQAAGAGAVLSGANPKNLLLAIGAAAAIAQTGIAVICLIIGAKLVGDAIGGFSS
jgi:hypothetical protein